MSVIYTIRINIRFSRLEIPYKDILNFTKIVFSKLVTAHTGYVKNGSKRKPGLDPIDYAYRTRIQS